MKKQPYIGMIPGHIKDGDDSRSDLLQVLGIDGLEPMSIGNYNDGRNDPPIAAVVIDGKQYSLKKIAEAYKSRIDNTAIPSDYVARGASETLSSEGSSGNAYLNLDRDIGEKVLVKTMIKSGYTAAKIECKAGDEFTITASVSDAGLVAWAFVDEGANQVHKLLDRGEAGADCSSKKIVAPAGTKYIVTNHKNSETYALTVKRIYEAASAEDLNTRVPAAPTTDGTYSLEVTVDEGTPTYGWVDRVPTAPTADGTYTLKVTVSSGTPTYSWVADAAE